MYDNLVTNDSYSTIFSSFEGHEKSSYFMLCQIYSSGFLLLPSYDLC